MILGQLPRACVSEGGALGGENNDLIDTTSGSLDHCLEFNQIWHTIRLDLETILEPHLKDASIKEGFAGEHKPEYFKGHCEAEGGAWYRALGSLMKHSDAIRKVYEKRKCRLVSWEPPNGCESGQSGRLLFDEQKTWGWTPRRTPHSSLSSILLM
jgi:hypothetical protein